MMQVVPFFEMLARSSCGIRILIAITGATIAVMIVWHIDCLISGAGLDRGCAHRQSGKDSKHNGESICLHA